MTPCAVSLGHFLCTIVSAPSTDSVTIFSSDNDTLPHLDGTAKQRPLSPRGPVSLQTVCRRCGGRSETCLTGYGVRTVSMRWTRRFTLMWHYFRRLKHGSVVYLQMQAQGFYAHLCVCIALLEK